MLERYLVLMMVVSLDPWLVVLMVDLMAAMMAVAKEILLVECLEF